MSNNKPWFIIISGPNGAGKTTFHDRILEQNPFFQSALFANSDIEFKQLMSLPENQKKHQELSYDIKQAAEDIRRKLLKKFSKTISSISGNANERLDKTNKEDIDEYWKEQYSLSIHVPQEQAYIIKGISKQKLMQFVSSSNLHERINLKTQKNNWYKAYERLINTVEIQDEVYVQPLRDQLANFETSVQRTAGENILKKMFTAFEKGENIIFETTGASHNACRFAHNARTVYHYNVFSFHPYVLHPKLSVARVQQRVANGGHNVPTDVVLQRYERSLKRLSTLLSEVDIGIVMDNSGKRPYMPIFAQTHGYIVDFAQCPEYLQPTRSEMTAKMPQKSVKELLHLQQDIDITKMTEEQRENFGQIVISNLLGQIR